VTFLFFLEKCLEIADRTVGVWCDMAASLREPEPESRGTSTGEDTGDWDDLEMAASLRGRQPENRRLGRLKDGCQSTRTSAREQGNVHWWRYRRLRRLRDGCQSTRTSAREQGNVHFLRYRRLRRLSTCCRELQIAWIRASAIVICSYIM
jgi:hypothetical protein